MVVLNQLINREHKMVSKQQITKLFKTKMVRYFFVAVAATLTDILILWLLTNSVGINYLIAATAGYLIGTYVNYLLGVMFVFESESKHSKRKEIAFVYAVTLTSAGINATILWFLCDRNAIHLAVAKFVSLGICFFYNFSMRQLFIFGEADTNKVDRDETDQELSL